MDLIRHNRSYNNNSRFYKLKVFHPKIVYSLRCPLSVSILGLTIHNERRIAPRTVHKWLGRIYNNYWTITGVLRLSLLDTRFKISLYFSYKLHFLKKMFWSQFMSDFDIILLITNKVNNKITELRTI
jgi:hypothetical protein